MNTDTDDNKYSYFTGTYLYTDKMLITFDGNFIVIANTRFLWCIVVDTAVVHFVWLLCHGILLPIVVLSMNIFGCFFCVPIHCLHPIK